MWRTLLMTGLLMLTPNALDAWQWPVCFLTSCIGPWLMSKSQKKFYKAARKLKKCAAQDKDYYRQILQNLASPMTAEDVQRIRRTSYATYGYLYKISQVIMEKTAHGASRNEVIRSLDKSILRKKHNSKEYIYFGAGNPKFDLLPNLIKEKYDHLSDSLLDDITKLEKAQLELKMMGKSYAPFNSYLEHQTRTLEALEAQKNAEENLEFAKLKTRYVEKLAEYTSFDAHTQTHALHHYLLNKTLSYKNDHEKIPRRVIKHDKTAQKNHALYQAILQKYKITLA
jgi:hypothetical protein